MTTIRGIHHVGVSVNNIDEALRFWTTVLEVEPIWRKRLDGPYLPHITGYTDIEIEAAMLPLPGGGNMELLDYQIDKQPNSDATANPGNVHLCLEVDDAHAAFQRAVDAGARPVSVAPVEITTGPHQGGYACYLRAPDGVTLEFFQR